jgi:hypothetical protein
VSDEEEYVIVWEAPEIVKPEFRLYYDKRGNVLFYTCEKPDGDYIVIDTLTFAEARPDIRVVDGIIVRAGASTLSSRLHRSTIGTLCEAEDVSIVTETAGQHWKLETKSL